ncbi:9301_t:CDS:2, partial [Racocetra fulgida]
RDHLGHGVQLCVNNIDCQNRYVNIFSTRIDGVLLPLVLLAKWPDSDFQGIL